MPVLLVGVRCPIEVVRQRRLAAWNVGYDQDGSVPKPVLLWQESVHVPGIYDLQVDTSVLSSEECAELIRKKLGSDRAPTAFRHLNE